MKVRVKRHAVIQPLDQSYRFLPLTQGQNAIVDLIDFQRLSAYNWLAAWQPKLKSFYALRYINGKAFFLHHAVLQRKVMVDHENHNTLDCRHSNLRVCTNSQNSMNRKMRKDNTSGFKGVTASKTPGKWESQIKINGKRIFLGTFSTKLDAAKAYDRQAKELFGEFASLNLR